MKQLKKINQAIMLVIFATLLPGCELLPVQKVQCDYSGWVTKQQCEMEINEQIPALMLNSASPSAGRLVPGETLTIDIEYQIIGKLALVRQVEVVVVFFDGNKEELTRRKQIDKSPANNKRNLKLSLNIPDKALVGDYHYEVIASLVLDTATKAKHFKVVNLPGISNGS